MTRRVPALRPPLVTLLLLIAASLAEGRPAFVVFTADWCITCKLNESTVLNRASIQAAFEADDYALFKADWTRRDEEIRAKLASLPNLPSEIRYRYYNVGRRFDVVLTFGAWPPEGIHDAVSTDLEAARKNYGAWVNSKDPLDVFLADVAAKRIKVKTWTPKDYTDQVKAKAKAGAHLDALLLLLEGTFAYADLPVAELAPGIDTQSKELLPVLRGMQLIGPDPTEADKLLRGVKRDGYDPVDAPRV